MIIECLGVSPSPRLSSNTSVEVVAGVNVVTSTNYNSVVIRSGEGELSVIARLVDIEALLLSIRILNVKSICSKWLGTHELQTATVVKTAC